MKACKNCGTKFDESVLFCPICGTNTRTNLLPAAGKEPISVGGWIGRTLIPCIPVVGSLVYLVMLFIWSGNKDKEETFRNWAKAQLIVIAIVVVLVILLAILGGVSASDILDSF